MGPRDSFPLNSNPTHYQENGHIMSASQSQHSRTRSSSPPKPALNITTTFPTQSHSRQPSQTYPQKSYSIPRPQQSSSQNQTFAPPPTKPTSSYSYSISSTVRDRPSPPNRQNTQTRYVSMLLALDDIPRLHNILVSCFTWLLLAGFIVFPGTFTSISKIKTTADPTLANQAEITILHGFKHVSLLVIGTISSSLGALGMCWMWFAHQDNPVWLLNKIFLAGCLNSVAGFIGTLIGVYGSQGGAWSSSAIVTGSVTGGCVIVLGALFAFYQFVVVEGVKKEHGYEMKGFEGGRKMEEMRRGGSMV